MNVCRELLNRHSTVHVHIYGRKHPVLEQVRNSLPEDQSERLHIYGVCDQKEILEQMRKCQVLFCPSATDCGPVPVIEALCCGISVAGGGNMLTWADAEGFGKAGNPKDDPNEWAQDIIDELEKWKRGEYNREEIAQFWKKRVSAREVASQMISFAREKLNKC